MFMKNSLVLDNQLCFALYTAANSIIRYYSQFLTPLGITYTQYLVLISFEDSKSLTIQQISKKLGLNPSTISPVIKRLVATDFIKKKRGEGDERVVIVSMSEKGKKLYKKLSKVQQMVFCKSGLTELEFKRIKNELDNLSAKFTTKENYPLKKISNIS
jgi:MarR family transcriptional regulator, organic hydroperoxide resistance regulator